MFIEKFIQDQIREELSLGVIEVTFTKADGSVRVMKCTMEEGKYPKPEAGKERKGNDDICIVWDVDVQDWRTFRWDRVQSVSCELFNKDGMVMPGWPW
jgi:hypothetical protein